MAKAAPLVDLDSLSHSARVQRAVELGRQSQTDPKAAQLLVEWRTGGFTQRLLAATACHGSRDVTTLAQLVADASRKISRVALSVMCDVGDDDSLVAALRTLPHRRIAKALFWLRRNRPKVVDRFVTERAAASEATAWPLVPLGSKAVVTRHFTLAAELGGSVFWRRLAVLHPALTVSEIIARLDAATHPDGLLFANARTIIAILSQSLPDTAFKVVAALNRHVPLSSIPLQVLAVQRPGAVADLVLASTDPVVVVRFDRLAHRLSVAQIIALYRRGPHVLGNPDWWLGRLSAADRTAIYRELSPAWTGRDGVIPVHLLRRLPTTLRPDEARRMIALPALAARPLQRVPYMGLLPWEEAREQVKPWLGHPEAENRAASLAALCEATRFERIRLGELLELLTARKHEQDPVRLVFLTSISQLPPGRWKEEHLPALSQVIRDALDASDLSVTSTAAIGRLIFSLLPFHPMWTVERLAELTRERGFPGWTGRLLTAEEVRRIAPALTPILKTWLKRERVGNLLSLASTVGRRLPEWPAMVKVLERLLTMPRLYADAAAMALLVKHVPTERERIVTTALTSDESWILQAPVMNYLHTRRQDLLTPFLGQRAYSGRFSTGRIRWILPFMSGFARWTDEQQEIFATSLANLAKKTPEKKTQMIWEVLSVIRRLPALPAIDAKRLIKLARDKRPVVQETAVRALGRLDARQGVPELLEALDDARARYAVYALRSALSEMPPLRVLEIMRDVPLRKVTVAKEAIRLAGEFGSGAALEWFAELDGRSLHRDVRGALLRALWDHLERSEAWAILDSSLESPDLGVVIGLARIQVDRASIAARERVANMLRKLLDHAEPTVRLAVLGRLAVQPVPDPKRVLLTATLEKFASEIPDERNGALLASLATARESDADVFTKAFTRLLPKRRELVAAVDEFARLTSRLGERLVKVRAAVSAVLETDPALVTLQIQLSLSRMTAEPFACWVLKWVGGDRWHAATQTAALDAITAAGRPAEELEQAEKVWAASTDAAARWLALRVLVHIASEQGWTEPRRKRLRRYGKDSSPVVADEAAMIFPPDPPAKTR